MKSFNIIILSLVLLCSCNKLKDDHEFLIGEWVEVDKKNPFSLVFTRNKMSYSNLHSRNLSLKIKSIESKIETDQVKNRDFINYRIYSYQYKSGKSFSSNLTKDTLFFFVKGSFENDEITTSTRILTKK